MNRKRAILIVLLGLASGLAAMLGASRSLSKRGGDAAANPPQRVVPVVVARADVPPGQKLRKEDLQAVSWPASVALPSAARRIEDVESRVAAVKLFKGEPVLADKLAPAGSPSGLAAFVSPGMRAVAVRVNEVIGVAGFVAPGNRVDVLTTIDVNRGGELAKVVTKVVLQDIQVLAVDRRADPAAQEAKGNPPDKVSVATLLVTPEQAERLTLAATKGQILLALRNTFDKTPVETPGVTPPELVLGRAAPPPPKKPQTRKPAASKPVPKPLVRIEVIRGGKKTLEPLLFQAETGSAGR